MKVMVIVKASKDSEDGVMPNEKLLTEMGQFNEELVKAGILLAGEGLHPSSKGKRVRFSGKQRTVIDGPFAETKELAAGFWMWKVNSMEEAVQWVKRCPNPMNEDSEIEIRPVFEASDFGDAFTPELREQEAAVRAQSLGLSFPRFANGRELLLAGFNESYTPETRVKIPAQWERFAPNIGRIPGQLGGMTAYGVCWNPQPGCGFDYLAGVEVSGTGGLPPGFTHVRIPAHRYVVFPHVDHVSTIAKTIDTIWNKWIPECGLKIADSPSFELYTEKFNPQSGTGGMEFWVPINS